MWNVLEVVVLLLLSLVVIDKGCTLLNRPSDFSVAIGIAANLGILGAWLVLLRTLWKRHLKRPPKMAIMLIMCSVLFGGCTRVGPGFVGIKVSMAGDNRGVSDIPLSTGWVFYNPMASNVFEYPTFVQTAVWTQNTEEGKPLNEEITFTTGDQMKVDADISLAYHLEAPKVPAFYVKFRNDDLEHFTHGFLRNLAREKFDNMGGKYKIEQIMGDNAQFLADVRKALQGELAPIGVELDQFGFIGAPRPPQAVINAINAKVEATQSAIKVENQIREVEAEAKKKIASAQGDAQSAIIRAEANAKANQILSNSIGANIIEWNRLQLQREAINRWNGVMPQYSASGMPFVQVPTK